jgi:cellobiose epimerase
MQVEDTIHTELATLLRVYKDEMNNELSVILRYWQEYTIDEKEGGFFGAVNNLNVPDTLAPKGLVLNSRILWAFSAAYNEKREPSFLETATRAFSYITGHFIDSEFGGAYWSVDHKGDMLDTKKQIYGLAFCLYGMSEYYKASDIEAALHLSKDLFNCIERYSRDKGKGGYVEAFTRDWKDIGDLRLSEKDDNEKKTMNTHLHIIEAYVNLYTIWPDDTLRARIADLLSIFDTHIVNKETGHLNLFFDDDWRVKSTLQSYGHDIEASWLLQECAAVIEDDNALELFRKTAIALASAASTGLQSDGGLWYEFEPLTSQLIREKHSWPQAEAMVGFFNAWQLTGEEKFLHYSLRSWTFIKQHIRDNEKGEWFWGVYGDYSIMDKDKAGFWKCPYHNTRACLEILKRIEGIRNSKVKIQK